jgi:6-aminohexanoate-oligomer endohydrolase
MARFHVGSIGVCFLILSLAWTSSAHSDESPAEPEADARQNSPDEKPRPQTSFSKNILEFDFESVKIGVAEYDEGPTGATVFYFPNGAFAAVDVRGGSPGTILTDGIRYGYDEDDLPWVDAVCFAGGSCYGLEAASGVMAELLEMRGQSNRWQDIAFVPGAIVFDFNNRSNAVYPDKELGRAALRSAQAGRFPLGARGAGRFVHVGGYFGPQFRERSGQGGAFRQLGRTKLAVFSVVNAVGAVTDRQGSAVRGNRDPKTEKRSSIESKLKTRREISSPPPSRPNENTTLTLVVTNQRLSYAELSRLAIQTHSSMSRGIQPFHTPRDGDTLFAVTTSEVSNSELSLVDLSTSAADLVWDAVLASIPVD